MNYVMSCLDQISANHSTYALNCMTYIVLMIILKKLTQYIMPEVTGAPYYTRYYIWCHFFTNNYIIVKCCSIL